MNSRHGEPTLEEMLSDPIIRAVMEADGIDPQELAATLRQAGRMLARRARRGDRSRGRFNARAGQVYANLISADRHFLFYGPPHGIRCKPLDEAARRVGAPPLRRQLRKEWKTRQGKQHIDQIAQRFGTQLAVLRHAANENG